MDSRGRLSPAQAGLLASAAWIVPFLLARSSTPDPSHPRVMLWYRTLHQPPFKPPDLAIPLAWAGLETLLAVSGYRLLRRRSSPRRSRALAWLAGNVVGIGAWSRLFFGGRSLPASTVAAAALAGSGVGYVAAARKVDAPAAAAAVPYVAWVAFATLLTAEIWRRNR